MIEFAQALHDLERHTLPVLYKAILEAAECDDLSTAIQLTRDVDSFVLHTEMAGPEDYARENLHRLKDTDDGINLAEFVNIHACGKKLMEHDNAIETTYGILLRKDGEPIQKAGYENQRFVMEM